MNFTTEPLLNILNDIIALRAAHPNLKPVSENLAVISIDARAYERLNDAGSFHATTARVDGELVGYAVYLVHTLMHYKDKLAASCGVSFMTEEASKLLNGSGYASLIEASERALKERGVLKVLHTVRNDYSGPIQFAVPGYAVIETNHERALN